MLRTFTLKNGLKVATYSIPEMRSVHIGIAFKGGSIFDTSRTSGLTHLMEHLLVQGIPSLPNVEDFSDYVEGLAGGYNAVTYSQSVRFHMNAPAAHLEDSLRITAEVSFEPLFLTEAIEREKCAVMEEIKQREDALWYKRWKFFVSQRYKKGHPLLLDTAGSIGVVEKLNREDLVKHWKKFFIPKNGYLVVVGGLDNETAAKLIRNYFEKYQIAGDFPGFPKLTENDLSEKKVAIRSDESLRSCYIDMNFPSVSDQATLKERLPRILIKNILGNLRGSRLYRLLRQRRGLVYDVGIDSSSHQYFGYENIYCQVAKDNLGEVIRLIVQELAAFVKSGPTAEELAFAKEHAKNRILMQFDHPSAIADWISGDLMWEDKIYTPEEYAGLINKVSAEDIKKFMQKYWDFDKLNLVIQGAVKNSKKNVDKFSKILEEL